MVEVAILYRHCCDISILEEFERLKSESRQAESYTLAHP